MWFHVLPDHRLLCNVSGMGTNGAAPADERAKQRRDGALAAVGRLVHEQCMAYYLAQSQHVEHKAGQRAAAEAPGEPPAQMVARTSFKVSTSASQGTIDVQCQTDKIQHAHLHCAS